MNFILAVTVYLKAGGVATSYELEGQEFKSL
jgi:hypothetical protein